MRGTFRSSGSFGKRQEFVAISELLRRGFDVYLTLVDDQGIDCVIRREDPSGHPKYLDVQVKARSKDVAPRDAAFFSAFELRNPRPNYLFMFYSEAAGTWWALPSLKLDEWAHRNKSGKNVGKRSIRLANPSTTGIRPRPKFRDFEGEAGLRLIGTTLDSLP